ncbi:MAG TPA: TonB family protein [Terriglobales bacterium]|nr:TonB family protein [Terriglobales bacterium]
MSTTETWKAWEGRIIDGKFPLRQWLGGSDHNVVFLTERPGSEPRKAVIKLIGADPADADRQLSRWRAATQLPYPALIRIFDMGRCRLNDASMLYLVMECADEDLAQILPQRALTPAEVGELLPPLLDAVSFLHSKGFVHGRIKPSNVLAVGNQLKLSADQIVSLAEPAAARTRRDVYDAPESAAGIVSAAGDLWSVGVTLVAALTQNVSFEHEPSAGNPGLPESIPEPFRGVARECLQLDPKRRCSIAEIKARLQPEGRSVPAPRELVPAAKSRLKAGPVAVAAIVVVLLVGLAVFLSRGKNTPTQNPVATEQSTTQASAPAPAPAAPQVHDSAMPSKKAGASRGEVIHQVLPEIPRSAKNTITGTIKVAVRVEVDASGKVTSARLVSSGPSKYFANQALSAARGWEFSTPVVNGQPTSSAWILRFRFKRGSTQASPERASR